MSNALAAAAVAIGLGAGVEKTAAALSRAVLVASGRMEVTDRPDGVRIINDAFNANPRFGESSLHRPCGHEGRPPDHRDPGRDEGTR
ncbi:hypothetical protein AB0D54_27900 [Streptomyces xanthophaeus]|uniref:hypothetical protein n=1 Tax=Streptomyces xanthophaeus TaxID=67385 RepID=UPI00343CEE5F